MPSRILINRIIQTKKRTFQAKMLKNGGAICRGRKSFRVLMLLVCTVKPPSLIQYQTLKRL